MRVRKFVVASLVVMVACVASIGPTAHAQTGAQSSQSYTTFTSPSGYQLQVPADWQPGPSSQASSDTDLYLVSPDGQATLLVFVSPVPSLPPDTPSIPVAFLAGSIARFAAQAEQSAVSVLIKPRRVTVINADDAAVAADQYTDQTGTVQDVFALAATRSDILYVVSLQIPDQYLATHPDLTDQISSSFKLVAAASTDLRTYASPNGYSFQYPASWRRLTPPPGRPADVIFVRNNGDEQLSVDLLPGPNSLLPNTDPIVLFKSAILPAFAARSSGFTAAAPVALNIPGADAGAMTVADYVDNDGIPYVRVLVLAVRGQAGYLLNLDVPAAYFQQYSDQIGSIVHSFKLVSDSTSGDS